MRMFKVSDELYEQLKGFVVDPFDDTPEVVISRLIEIVGKAKDRWPAFEVSEPAAREAEPPAKSRPARQESREDESVVVL
jgi:hypothetical protein